VGCSSSCPSRIFASSSWGVFTWYLVSISWVSARVVLSMVFRYSLIPLVTNVSGARSRFFEILSMIWFVSVI